MRTLDVSDVLPVLEQVVADVGEDYVYPRTYTHSPCIYVHDGEPSCGVGHVLHRLGVPLEPLTDKYLYTSYGVRGLEYNELHFGHHKLMEYLEEQGYEFTDEARDLLLNFQNYQDDGTPWRTALDLAFRRTEDA